jgi:hypothetical protein
MMTKQINPISQFFSTYPNKRLIGMANTIAVNAESCRGETFFVENMLQVTSYEF